MPKITSVEPQKNPHRFNIFLDGEFAFGADEDLVVEYRLVPEKLLDTTLVEKLLFEVEVGKLMERMYRLFNIRQRSEQEIRKYLRSLSFKRKVKNQEEISEAAVELLINKLKQKRLLNDEEFVKAWVTARGKKYGKNRIKQELFEKGIDKEIINGIMNDESRIMGEEQVANQSLEKKIRLWKNLPALQFKKKAYDYLLRRGFEYETVKSIVEKLLQKKYNIIRESES